MLNDQLQLQCYSVKCLADLMGCIQCYSWANYSVGVSEMHGCVAWKDNFVSFPPPEKQKTNIISDAMPQIKIPLLSPPMSIIME